MRILLIEDEPDLGVAIKKTLNQHHYIVDWVLDGQEAWYYLDNPALEYILGIFDWLLPGLSGIELLRRLRQKHHHLPVLMLTAKDTLEDKVMGLDAGADDYLVKPFGMIELLARIRALQRRSPQFHPQQFQVGDLILDYGTNTVEWRGVPGKSEPIFLTSKEFQLLEYFMRHPHQILTRDQLLDQLWELGIEPISNVVAAQIRLLRKKLKQAGCDHLIETVYKLGYRLVIDTNSV